MSTYIQLLIDGMGRAFDLRGNRFGEALIETKKGGYFLSKIEPLNESLNKDYEKAKEKLSIKSSNQTDMV